MNGLTILAIFYLGFALGGAMVCFLWIRSDKKKCQTTRDTVKS